ncbi:tetratricopeptide repeat protein [Sulfurospirillum sp. 1307]|jgi:hypothetical protein
MFNAEDIIELEKKWLRYKIKQKIKNYSIFLFLILIILSSVYFYLNYSKFQYFFTKKEIKNIEIVKNEPKSKEIVKKEISKIDKKQITKVTINEEKTKPIVNKKETTIDKNSTTKNSLHVEDNISKVIPNKELTKKQEPYSFKLIASNELNELFSSSGELLFNPPYVKVKKAVKEESLEKKQVSLKNTSHIKKEKSSNISIDMKEIDTIAYLKEKFYKTSSVVFALMIAEEYYNQNKYKDSLKWSLIANDVDSLNDKSWYWFAKSKIKLGQIDDAKKALNAYLKQNKSKRLSMLLNKIQHGDLNGL